MGKICSKQSSVNKKTQKIKRYNITQENFTKVYENVLKEGGGVKDAAKILGTSDQYVRRHVKKYGLKPLGKHGGYRKGAGRPSGSKNKSEDIIYKIMMRQQEIDQRVNSREVKIKQTAAVWDEDIFKYAGSAYCNNKRKHRVENKNSKTGKMWKAIVPGSLPCELKCFIQK